MPNYPLIGIDDSMPFGKYKGRSVDEILDDDPEYLAWCIENLNTEFTTEALLALQAAGY